VTDPSTAADEAVAEPEPEQPTGSRWPAIIVRTVAWVAFVVLFGLLPLLVAMVRAAMSPHGLDLTEVLGRGELFLVSAVIGGTAIGALVTEILMRDYSRHPTAFKVFAILFGCTALIALVANTIGYMVDAEPETIRTTSEWLFLVTVVPSGIITAMVAQP
jgi:hypothetical protein